MGTVHAKADNVDSMGGGIFEFEEPIELDDEPIPKPTIKLNGVRVEISRTKTLEPKTHCVFFCDTAAIHIINPSSRFGSTGATMELVLVNNAIFQVFHFVRRALDSMGCFRDIGVYIDVSSGPGSTPEGLEVTFQVKELSRIVGGINTTVSENEGNLVLGVKMPNVLGRGEKLQAEYSMGYRSSSNFSLTATKPYPHKPLVPVLSASLYQQNHEYPWSGYRLLDRGILLDLAFKSSPVTRHNLQWEGMVRDTSVLSKTTSFKVRESSGPQMKSILRHIVTVDHRDEPIFPTKGSWVQFTSELAGLGGGVANLKTELHAQTNHSLFESVVLQVTGSLGVLHDMFGTEIPDHFFLGGATTLRGFTQRGVGPTSDGQYTGGTMYWASGVHVYTPLPFQPGKNGLGSLFRSHMFLNAGCLALPEEKGIPALESLRAVRRRRATGRRTACSSASEPTSCNILK
ncbi:hypothetical protein K1T71_001015 [Dendrolimus kikuchii]|uniref:Uncharacterized protein n=1 Tax=Dendrolimus kikuchii TaxID=765133 RepID=A0ACC1DGZ5_9NEOP|nr:hypothetical protein K1T71_001015 [Dendrolimus kikuchii]